MTCDRKIGPFDCCSVVQGDCLELLSLILPCEVDCVVTSPPYNTLPSEHKPSGLHAERKSGINKWIQKAANGYFDQREEGEYQEWLRDVVGKCLRSTRGLVWVNHKVRYRDGEALHPARFLPFPIYAEVIWNRRGSMALNCKRYAPSHEVILGFGRPYAWNDELNTELSVWDIPPQLSEEHPCPYPEEIPMRLIKSSTNEGDTVLEPFSGSGTTLVAAKKLGRHFLGFEISGEYCAIARDRLAMVEAQPTLFEPKPEQLELGGQ